MKGYLKSPGHSYIIDADIVSIGKGYDNKLVPPEKFRNAQAHIPITTGKADPHHAVIERHFNKNSFCLTDLNSAYGTYVNESRIQNTTVKLTPGDRIRFGYGGVVHEFGIYQDENESEKNGKRPNSSSSHVESGYIYHLGTRNKPFSVQTDVSSVYGFSSNLSRPDTAPESKNPQVLKLIANKRATSVPTNIKMTRHSEFVKTNGSEKQTEGSIPNIVQEEWSVDGHDVNDFCDRDTTFSKTSSWEKEQESEPWYVSMLREKEQRLLHMGEEISRLTTAQQENIIKDDVITDLRNKLTKAEIAASSLTNSAEITEKTNELLQLGDEINRLTVNQQECERKDILITTLKEQIANLEMEKEALVRSIEFANDINTIPPNQDNEEWKATIENQSNLVEKFEDNLTDIDVTLVKHQDELDEFRKQLNLPIPERKTPQEMIMELVSNVESKEEIINQLKGELKEAKHEKNISQGFAHALQRDVTRNEQKISKMTTALEKQKRETQEAIAKSKAMSNKFTNLKEDIKHEEIVAVLEKNYCETQEKLKECQQQLTKHQYKYDKQSKELRRLNRQTKQHQEKEKFLHSQLEELETEIQDLRQKEQESRVFKEQTASRLERLRSRIIQAVYTAPGSIKPEAKLDDSEILSAVQKLINDRSDYHGQLCDLGQQMPPLVMTLELQSEDGSDIDLPQTTPDKRASKGNKKTSKK